MIELPEVFEHQIREKLGLEFLRFRASLEEQSPVSIRINPRKQNNIASTDKVAWSNYGFYLNERPRFTFDPLFHAGTYYVQEASSMFLEQVFKQHLSDE